MEKDTKLTTILERAKDRIRVSIRAISFISEHQGRVNVASLEYHLQDKNQVKILDPQTGQPVHQIQTYKKSTEQIDVIAEPLLEDLINLNKIIFEMYMCEILGLPSEAAEAGFTFEDNLVIKKLLSIRKTVDDKSEQMTIFDELTKRGEGKIKGEVPSSSPADNEAPEAEPSEAQAVKEEETDNKVAGEIKPKE